MSEPLDAEHVMSRDFVLLEGSAGDHPAAEVGARYVLVTQGGRVIGFALPGGGTDEAFRVVDPGRRWPELMRTLKAHACERLVVATGDTADSVVGVITPREVARAARDKADLMD
ncbi:MAG: hypothetical protein U5K43_06375 [Halofilum sp. (in: g-proteobacteria)]|nr:hypothetical protein [Halofilum sp. (in: g-proteobacteria)]